MSKQQHFRLEYDTLLLTMLRAGLLSLLSLLWALVAFAESRVYELRTYTCVDGKLEQVEAIFRETAIPLFKEHHIESLGYWIPQDPKSGHANTLIYIVSHPSREQAKKNWGEFHADPRWVKAMDGIPTSSIIQRVQSIFMDPTDFSALK